MITSEPRTLIAPREAIFREGPNAAPYVFVRQPAGWARRNVELGPTNHVSAAIRSGLRAGDVIARQRPPESAAGGKRQ